MYAFSYGVHHLVLHGFLTPLTEARGENSLLFFSSRCLPTITTYVGDTLAPSNKEVRQSSVLSLLSHVHV
jgi:hypothetical protein